MVIAERFLVSLIVALDTVFRPCSLVGHVRLVLSQLS